MSLRGFHVVFITLSILLSFFVAWFGYVSFQQEPAVLNAVVTGVAGALGMTMLGYGIWFVRKSRALTL